MPRYEYGPVVPLTITSEPPGDGQPAEPTPEPGPAPKLDPEITINSVDAGGYVVRVDVPAYDLSTHNALVAVHAVYSPTEIDQARPASELMAAGHPTSSAGAPLPDVGGVVELVQRTKVSGMVWVQTVREFAE